jgi:hypothetical protein
VTFAEQIAARGRKSRVVCGSQCHSEEFAEFDDLSIGSVSAGSGKSMRFNGTTVPRLENALSTEVMGLDGDVAVAQQAGIAGLAAFGLDESPAADWAQPTRLHRHR